jgi:hypothetical protein
MNKPRKIGVYPLGLHSVELWVDPNSSDGRFDLWPNREVGHLPRIQVGLARKEWHETVAVLMHEALEFASVQNGARFLPSPDYADSSGGYLFSMDHEQFADLVARAAEFITPALPELSKAWKKGRK